MLETEISEKELKALTKISSKRSISYSIRQRASIIKKNGEKKKPTQIGKELGICRKSVWHWVKEWNSVEEERNGLALSSLSEQEYEEAIMRLLWDKPKSGHPKKFSEGEKEQIRSLAKQRPESVGVPITNWTHVSLAQAASDLGYVVSISPAHVGRFLKESRY